VFLRPGEGVEGGGGFFQVTEKRFLGLFSKT
jgi:hypothetical protein